VGGVVLPADGLRDSSRPDLMPSTIRKYTFLQAMRCPTMGWFAQQGFESEPDKAARFWMDEGNRVHELARSLWPDARMIEGYFTESLRATPAVLADPAVEVVLEAALQAGPYRTRADVLIRDGGGWRMLEIKSGLIGGGSVADYTKDAAYTLSVLTRAGLDITSVGLILIDKQYRKGMPIDRLFGEVDVTAEATALAGDYARVWDDTARILTSDKPPEPRLNPECRYCEHFDARCIGQEIEHPVLLLPRIRAETIEAYAAAGILELAQLAGADGLSVVHERVVAVTLGGERRPAPNLAARLAEIEHPVHYLDFETTQTALPLFEDVAPYEQIVTQYSLHTRRTPGADLEHREFLARTDRDDRRALAEQLLEDLGDRGSIVVYSPFEKGVLTKLAVLFPDLVNALEAAQARLFDLLPVVRECVYDAAFRGSFGLKSVLPALCPDLGYDDLEIQSGALASVLFARMARGEIAGDEAERVRHSLLEYCERDTLAMVRLHERLGELASA